MTFVKYLRRDLMLPLVVLMAAMPVFAQTSAFTYQGRLTDNGMSANGAYQFEFRLFDAPTGVNQVGSTITDLPATVTGGIFTVQLDFGAAAFNGLARYLEIGVRMNGSPNPYTLLSPRQSVTSTPYAIRSLNSTTADTAATATNSQQLGGVAANQYVITTDARMSDARNPLPFSQSYIQNTAFQQLGSSNFNISGSGTADTFNALAEYRINGDRIFGIPGNSNTFAGLLAGASNTSGAFNTFLGRTAGNQNLGGGGNTFVGALSGESNTSAQGNSFFGAFSGRFNTGGSNSFFGSFTGAANLGGGNNSFFGESAGSGNTSGSDNTFLGRFAGSSNTTGFRNTMIGHGANVGANNLTNATAIGWNAVVNTSNTMVLGTNVVTVSVPGDLAVNGTQSANAFNATTAYNIGGNRVLSATEDTTFVGVGVGTTNTGVGNSFFGSTAGNQNTTGVNNSFFGSNAGRANMTGNANSFFGFDAGHANTSGFNNAFFGYSAGGKNTIGSDNAFFGVLAGDSNTEGLRNSFFGGSAGFRNTTGQNNTFVGSSAGENNTASNNTFIGNAAGLTNTTATSNTFVGSFAGLFNTTGNSNAFFGISAGQSNTEAINNSFFGGSAGFNNTTGNFNSFIGAGAGLTNTTGDNNTLIGSGADVGANNLNFATAIGSGAVVTNSNTIVLGRNDGSDFVRVPGFLTIPSLAVAGNENLCRNAFDRIGSCSSSLRYKTNLQPFTGGLNIINRMRPITFTWKDGGMRDVGFGAEEVEKIEPLLVTRNRAGEIEGVKYGQISAVLINAVKEQQTEIELLQQQVKSQQRRIDALNKLACQSHPDLEICK